MTLYPDGDKPIRIATTYKCPLCEKNFHVYWSRGQNLENAVRLHRTRCEGRVKDTGGIICRHLGPVTDKTIKLGGCGEGLHKLFECAKHELCLPFVSCSRLRRAKLQNAPPACEMCDDYDPVPFRNSELCGQGMAQEALKVMGKALDPGPAHNPSNTPTETSREAE